MMTMAMVIVLAAVAVTGEKDEPDVQGDACTHTDRAKLFLCFSCTAAAAATAYLFHCVVPSASVADTF